MQVMVVGDPPEPVGHVPEVVVQPLVALVPNQPENNGLVVGRGGGGWSERSILNPKAAVIKKRW